MFSAMPLFSRHILVILRYRQTVAQVYYAGATDDFAGTKNKNE